MHTHNNAPLDKSLCMFVYTSKKHNSINFSIPFSPFRHSFLVGFLLLRPQKQRPHLGLEPSLSSSLAFGVKAGKTPEGSMLTPTLAGRMPSILGFGILAVMYPLSEVRCWNAGLGGYMASFYSEVVVRPRGDHRAPCSVSIWGPRPGFSGIITLMDLRDVIILSHISGPPNTAIL